MPKRYSSKQVIKALTKQGFVFVSQKGSHLKYRKEDRPPLTVIVPAERQEIPVGTFHSILRQSNLTEEHFK